ncbi:MAG: replication and repair protein RecF [Chloroflexota bacterium]|jgi:DNA replication and repair protein RecF|nr:replication and repair protein RecF [Chloroflexota bacterium]
MSSASDLGELAVTSEGMLQSISIRDLRSYASLEASFGPGPQLIVGPNAAGKTTLLEAIVLLAWGRSHRTSSDGELVRWGSELARIEGLAGRETVEVALVRPASGGSPGSGGGPRKRIRVNGVPRRAAGLAGLLRTVVFAPEEMLLVIGSPGLRRAALDQLAIQRSAAYGRDLAAYTRTLQQRNSLLRAIREEQAGRDELRFWDGSFLDAGGAVVAERLRLLGDIAGPLARAHAEIAPDEAGAARLTVDYATNAPALPGESPRDALARRLVETAEKEVWNGSTLVGPHRDDLVFGLDGRDMSGFASRGQQRTAILAFKLAELDLLTEQDGRPPLLLLDDVFSELDPERRAHLVRRISELPQAFVTTTTLDDLDPALVAAATSWEVLPDAGNGAGLRLLQAGPLASPGVAS